MSHASDRYPKHPAVPDDQVPAVRVDALTVTGADGRHLLHEASRTLRARLVALTGRKAVTVL
ncbi:MULTISPECIES: hypothetical protein [Streptomyces]|uniref:hypothetical protein n=1 Tax=Streptomyces TaxID=1883 RepID=UPI00073DF623|nr:hypothetical protein [Streptomyces sp. EAS-AB2608]MYU30477.1 hypothetical protein [Streptomyces sp. SID7810]BCM69942.1 hypothetical protein EASAB2608_05276 [Streptomyces sp. EAS-AB2608]CUW31548.1 hypothetical protein TUE45_06296 [Streptomyces reticuli]